VPTICLWLTSLNAISAMSAEAALILDDYHLIVTPAIHTAVAFLLDHLPPQLHLIMLTRADPPLSLTRLRSRGELAELRAADLCFTADEAVTFLTDVMGLPLTNDQLAAAKAQLAGAQANLARTKAGPLASELLAAQAQVDSAQAEVAAARVDLARAASRFSAGASVGRNVYDVLAVQSRTYAIWCEVCGNGPRI
jgi:hypothetical protein